eukprot:g3163.t1
MLTTSSNRSTSKDGVHLQVVVRCRPLSPKELTRGVQSVIHCSSKEVTISDKSQTVKRYTFDRVFGPESTQEHLFDEAIRPFVENVIDGFNCTIFAYGQTGTGKTYTMTGAATFDDTKSTRFCQIDSDRVRVLDELPKDAGIIPRTVKRIFQKLQGSDSTVTVNFLELYNEELTDLLDPWLDQVDKDGNRKKKIMKIMEEQLVESGAKLRRGILLNPYPEDCVVTKEAEIMQILDRGNAQRQTAETLLNDKSSRSHSIFVISIHTRETKSNGEDVIKVGKLNLVDLAGSENVSRSGSDRREERQRETGSINQSLLTLGRVINALVDKSAHVPYRDSNLTRLLRDSLGGSTKTLMIATISSDDTSQEETYKTLDYAIRAKSIKNKPEVNQRISRTDLVKELHAEIKRLKEELVQQRRKEGVIAISLEKHAENEAGRKAMLLELDKCKDETKEFQNQFIEVSNEMEKLRKMYGVVESELHKRDELINEQSLKLQDQMYWSQTYQKNCTVLNDQLQKQTSNIEEMVNSVQSYKTAFEILSDKLTENESLSAEAGEIIKTQIDEASSFLEKALDDYQSRAGASLKALDAKKNKREKQNSKIQQAMDQIGQSQQQIKKEVMNLWPKSLQKIDEEIQSCQVEYSKLKEATEAAIQSQFDEIQTKATANQNQLIKEQETLKQQYQSNSRRIKIEKERIAERKRKLDELKTAADRNDQASMELLQQNTAQIFQQVLTRCMQEAIPQIYQTIATSLQPQKSLLNNCSDYVQDLESTVDGLVWTVDQETARQELAPLEVQQAKELVQHEFSSAGVKLSKHHNELKDQGLQSLTLLKNSEEQSQRLLEQSIEGLKKEIEIGVQQQSQNDTSFQKELKSLCQITNDVNSGTQRHLASLKKKYTSLHRRFDWEVPSTVLTSQTTDEPAVADDEGTSVKEEADQESVSVKTTSSEKSKVNSNGQIRPKLMKENLTDNQGESQSSRVMRKAKRGKQSSS